MLIHTDWINCPKCKSEKSIRLERNNNTIEELGCCESCGYQYTKTLKRDEHGKPVLRKGGDHGQWYRPEFETIEYQLYGILHLCFRTGMVKQVPIHDESDLVAQSLELEQQIADGASDLESITLSRFNGKEIRILDLSHKLRYRSQNDLPF